MNEPQHNLTGVWALNALDAEERARLERYLAEDPDAAAEARSFEETAGEMARSLEPIDPRPEVKSAVMARVSQTRQMSPRLADEDYGPENDASDEARGRRAVAEPTRHTDDSADTLGATAHSATDHDTPFASLDHSRSTSRRSRWLAVAAAALLATTLASLGLWNTERDAQQEARATIEAMGSAQSKTQDERQIISRIMASDDLTQLTIPAKTSGQLTLIYSREQQAMLVQTVSLPEIPEDQTFQLWIIDDSARSVGLISAPDEPMIVSVDIPPAATLGLSIEPNGGSKQPTNVILAGDL